MLEQALPTTEAAPKLDVAGDFQRAVWDPEVTTVKLHGESVEPTQALKADQQTGIATIARLAVPKEPGTDGHVMVGHHPTGGYFVAGPESDLNQIGNAVAGHKVMPPAQPMELGAQPGSSLTVGREGFSFRASPGAEAKAAPPHWSSAVKKEFGPDTSRQQFTLTVTDNGGLRITDHSTNGTRIQTRSPQEHSR